MRKKIITALLLTIVFTTAIIMVLSDRKEHFRTAKDLIQDLEVSNNDTLPDERLISLMQRKAANYKNKIKNKDYSILVDYNKPIFTTRLWVIESSTGKIVLRSEVSHAYNSGVFMAENFSNVENSNKSCTGCFITGETYYGQFGYSMKIHGLEKGKNDNAFRRYIVFHQNEWPWSKGCFMTKEITNKRIIDLTNGGAFLYVHKD